MKTFRIIKKITGKVTNIYSIVIDESKNCVFEQFLVDFYDSYGTEINHLVETLDKIANNVGIRDGFFKDQGIGSIFRFINAKDKKSTLRLYCIKWGGGILILGGGGIKDVRTWQEDPVLSKRIRELDTIDKYLYDNQVDLEESANNNTVFESEV